MKVLDAFDSVEAGAPQDTDIGPGSGRVVRMGHVSSSNSRTIKYYKNGGLSRSGRAAFLLQSAGQVLRKWDILGN